MLILIKIAHYLFFKKSPQYWTLMHTQSCVQELIIQMPSQKYKVSLRHPHHHCIMQQKLHPHFHILSFQQSTLKHIVVENELMQQMTSYKPIRQSSDAKDLRQNRKKRSSLFDTVDVENQHTGLRELVDQAQTANLRNQGVPVNLTF